ncbi:MAG: glycosyltransferase [bacterium]
MAGADRAVGSPRGATTADASGRALSIVACVPLPYRSDGRITAEVGVTNFYAALLPRLAALGHRVHALVETPPVQPGETRVGLDWQVAGLSADWNAFEYWPGRRPLDDEYTRRIAVPLAQALAARCARARPDLVLIGREVVAPAAVDACCDLGLPSLLVAHGVAVAALQSDAYPRLAAARLLASLRRVDRIIAVAAHLAATLRGLAVAPVTSIANVVDAEQFQPAAPDAPLRAALTIAPESLVVGHASNLTDHKRVADLVAAAPRVLAAQPHTVFLIIGDGVERAALQRQVQAAGLQARFRFVGEVAHARMPDHLNLCDVVVMPSERETLSLVYRETQACGGVLLTSDIAAAREAVVDGETGVLFRKGDRDDLAAQLLALLADAQRRQRIGRAARRAAAALDPGDWAREYEAALRSTAG